MNTRSKQKSGGQEAGTDRDDGRRDPLTRQSIKSFRTTAKGTEDKIVAGLGESPKTKANIRDGITSYSNKKNNIPNSRKPAAVKEIIREDDSNHSSQESDNEEESSEELQPTSVSNIRRPLVKGESTEFVNVPSQLPSPEKEEEDCKNYTYGQGDKQRLSSLRLRKGEKKEFTYKQPPKIGVKKEFSYKQQQKMARPLLLDTNRIEAYSDGEEDQPQAQTSTRSEENQPKSEPVRGTLWFLVIALIVIFMGAWMVVLKNPSTLGAEQQLQVMNTFQDKFRKLPILFSGQSSNLWHRSQRILELQIRHRNENKEPAIILLTAAQDAKQVLYCISNHLAKTYASTLNGSYTVFSGTDNLSEDSEDVKMDIDQKLSEGFQGNSKAAVLHRLELLPPGSLIILYKYCDHENAAFKNVALVLTVLLKDSSLKQDIGLNELEERVYDFLKETFIDEAKSRTSHNEMDGDKLGGVWSRISHVVLPVFPGEQILKECDESKASP